MKRSGGYELFAREIEGYEYQPIVSDNYVAMMIYELIVSEYYVAMLKLRRFVCNETLESSMQLVYLLLSVYALLTEVAAPYEKRWDSREEKTDEEIKRSAVRDWAQTHEDLTAIDATIIPDFWAVDSGAFPIDPRVATNGAEPPEQLVKVTDRRHKFPILATICSIGVLVTFITLLIICTS